ncbi:MAG: aspartate/glutamate racemase family protein [Dehalococcoidales bacterium]|nr:aspartate/glutamate racemase family protein [Dehalococcoidales bacterium]
MKVIGLIGGMSWNSTLEYYRLINEIIAARLGGLHSARIVLYSLDFEEIESTQRESRWDDASSILAEAGKALKQAGADFLLICTNTMHKVADAVKKSSGLPVLHIADAAGNAIREQSLARVGLLGTKFVMEEHFYRDRLKKHYDIDVIVPKEDERAIVHRTIYDELCLGNIRQASRQACLKIVKRLKERGAEGIILGCTELPLLIRPGDVQIPLFDTTRLHAEAAAELALGK